MTKSVSRTLKKVHETEPNLFKDVDPDDNKTTASRERDLVVALVVETKTTTPKMPGVRDVRYQERYKNER